MKGYEKKPSFNLQHVHHNQTRRLFETYHRYKSIGSFCTYCFGVIENKKIVAAFIWQPPAPGVIKSICPKAPYGVLSLSRMVAVPRKERNFQLSRVLKWQMKNSIDRGRWPVLLTYSDEGLGHTGKTYELSGWTKTVKSLRKQYELNGKRVSSYANGSSNVTGLERLPDAYIQRWEHWICNKEEISNWLPEHGWRHVQIPGKKWRSGNQAMKWIKI